MENWYKIKNIDEIDSPALVIYKERVEENIRVLLSMIDDPKRSRPHVKTHKSKEVSQMMLEAGIEKFKCATIAEAEMLAIVNAPDVLLAYQPYGPKLQRFISLANKYPATTFSCLVDNLVSATNIAEAAASNGIVIPIYIDINLGMNRTGITPDEDAIDLYDSCTCLKGVQLKGLHGYDGHFRSPDFEQRTKESNEAFLQVEEMKKKLAEKGFAEPIIIAGGSPTFPIHAKRKDVECSPGTFIFWDKGYQTACPEQPFVTAALVVSRVISLPDKNTLCLDLGHKSIASENELGKRVYFLNAPELKFIGHSEEHLVAEVPEGHSYKPGNVLYGLPYHICPTCALYERALVVENHEVVDEWKIIARDRKITV
ncbi:D-TA family PLP-dependent enzyme [Segetibacter aerophilus]|uniref:Threonine aldolase n=1 Tax=Segetibacter aerophilus TaxID=670293 RepID=A0A512BGQ1_9BACT|nr:D-TA family PLP-dependent enzyme [Segetibacter aerophilus]GEO11144.1 threonine aldolase [Segetibacter aerophilus]